MPEQERKILELKIRSYTITVYIKSECSLSWIIKEKSKPDNILLSSERDFVYSEKVETPCAQIALQDAVTTLSKWVRKHWPKVDAL
jgi:hypothetical protein